MALAAVPIGIVGEARAWQRVGEVESTGLLDAELLAQEAALVVAEGAVDVRGDALLVTARVALAGVLGRGR